MDVSVETQWAVSSGAVETLEQKGWVVVEWGPVGPSLMLWPWGWEWVLSGCRERSLGARVLTSSPSSRVFQGGHDFPEGVRAGE